MEFAHVGSHCDFVGCNQQDFLPFQCDCCGDIHCADHRRPPDHKCRTGGPVDDNFVIMCPICQARLSMKGTGNSEATAETIWNRHVDSGDCNR